MCKQSPFIYILYLYLLVSSVLVNAGGEMNNVDRVKSPNVILIVSDNQSPSLIGSYGNKEIKTPNIDLLAQQGVQFNNAFAVSGVCSPTRATLLTGLLPSQTGVHNALPSLAEKGHVSWSAIEEFRTIPQTLSQLGYRTALIGKYHLGSPFSPQLGFDEWVTFKSGHTKSFYDVEVIDNGKEYKVSEHLTDFWTKKAVDYIQRQSLDAPFFLLLAYNGPYMLPPTVNEVPRNRYADWYLKNKPNFPQHAVHPYLENWARGAAAPTEQMSNDSTHAWAAIRALNNEVAMINTASETTMVDDGVGDVMMALQKAGLDENTVVIYTSDQGSSRGEHGLWGNTSWAYPFPAYDSHLRIPLIIHHPEKIKDGFESSDTINQVDIFPTILDYIGRGDIEIKNTPGKSFLPILEGREKDWANIAFFEFMNVRGVRTADWKLIKRFPEGPNELYKVRSDPDEMNNLIEDENYRKVVVHLEKMIDTYYKKFANPKYDLWNGGTAKARLMEDYGKNHIFSERFPDWIPPLIEKNIPFQDEK